MRIGDSTTSGLVLLAAGGWQLSSLKRACLTHCRSPVAFLVRHRRSGSSGALRMGLHHALYCLGCCWALMLPLFVGGVMNAWWIAGLALFVYVEKRWGAGAMIGRVAGYTLIAVGLLLLGLAPGERGDRLVGEARNGLAGDAQRTAGVIGLDGGGAQRLGAVELVEEGLGQALLEPGSVIGQADEAKRVPDRTG